MNKNLYVCTCLLAVILLAGCGKSEKKFALSGSVTFQGQPVEQGEISFVPEDPNAHFDGAPIVDGKYTCEVTPGPKTVRITGSRRAKPAKGDNPDLVLYEDFIPAKFNLESELRYEVTSPATQDFSLE